MSANRAVRCSVYKRGRFTLHLKGTRKGFYGHYKDTLHQESSVKGVGVCGVYHNTSCISEDII